MALLSTVVGKWLLVNVGVIKYLSPEVIVCNMSCESVPGRVWLLLTPYKSGTIICQQVFAALN